MKKLFYEIGKYVVVNSGWVGGWFGVLCTKYYSQKEQTKYNLNFYFLLIRCFLCQVMNELLKGIWSLKGNLMWANWKQVPEISLKVNILTCCY
jgi:hypothetical protein